METDYRSQQAVAAAVEEVTKGTYIDPTLAGVVMYDTTPIKVDTSPVRAGNSNTGTMVKSKQYSGTRKGSTSGKIELKGSGDPTTAAAIAKFLKASGMYEQTVNTDKIGYIMNGIPSCDTISFKYQSYNCGALPAAYKQSLSGARCNFKISAANVGAPILIDLEIAGAARPVEDVASGSAPLTAVDVDTTDCEKLLEVITTVGGQIVNLTSFEFTGGFALNPREDSREAGGVLYSDITDMDMKLSATWATQDVATKDYYGDMVDDVVYNNITIPLKGWDLIFTGAQIFDMATGDGNGFLNSANEIQVEQFEMNQKEVV